MANRTMLYGIAGYIPGEAPETVHPISESPYAVPFNYLVLVSGKTQVVPSLIFDGGPALIGDYRIGLTRFRKLAGLMRIMGKDTSRLVSALDEFQAVLEQKPSDYFLCEPLEVMAMIYAQEEWQEVAQSLAQEAADWGDWIDSITGSEAEQIETMRDYFAAPGDDSADEAEILLDDDFDNNDRGDVTLQLYTSDVLYFTIPTRAEAEAHRKQAENDPDPG